MSIVTATSSAGGPHSAVPDPITPHNIPAIMLTVKSQTGMIYSMARRSRSHPALLSAVVAAWLDNYESPHTRAAYGADLNHFGQWSDAEGVNPFALTEEDLRRYRAVCEASGARPATVARRLSAIASFAGFASECGEGLGAPRIDRPTLPVSSATESLSSGDAVALLAAADQINPRAGLLVRLMMLDGLKVGELVHADAAGVSGRPPAMTLALRTPNRRVIELHPDTAPLLTAYLGRRRRGPLVLSEHRARTNQGLTRFGVDYVVKQAVEAAGIGGPVSANTLRRRFVVSAQERGENLDDIRESVGHADSRTTRRYLHSQDLDRDPSSDK